MTPFSGSSKLIFFENASCKDHGDAKTYQLSGPHSVEALMQKYSQSARKNNKFLVFPQI